MKKVVVRTRILKPGDVVTVRPCQGAYRLPEGLPADTVVTVVRTAPGYADVVDANGHPWTVALANIEMPCSLWWRGEWIDYMTHPEGQIAWRAFLEQSTEAANQNKGAKRRGSEMNH